MFQRPSRIHFIGICGTAMASVAVALQERGYQIAGSDANIYPPMSTFLNERKIHIHPGYKPGNLDWKPDLVVVGNAISRGNPELEEMLDRRMPYLSLPEVLKEFFLRHSRNLVVTGTHGKTTTASCLAWILESTGRNPSYMIGGLPQNLKQGAVLKDSPLSVLEGDEYDTAFFDKRSKFLHYLPEVVIMNNIEFDHADIYENLEQIKLSFKRLVNIVPRNGLILANADDESVRDVLKGAHTPVLWVGTQESAQVRITQVESQKDGVRFRLGGTECHTQMSGLINVRNVSMALLAAKHVGVEMSDAVAAMSRFSGVRRRQEVRAEVRGVTVIDDFGHHPTAIRETLEALKSKFAGRRIWAFFEPRSNTTRRAVFQKELPSALALADGVFVSQVARLDQIPENNRLNPEQVIRDILHAGKKAFYLPTADAIVSEASRCLESGDVAVIFSNGGFDGLHEKLIQSLEGVPSAPAPSGS